MAIMVIATVAGCARPKVEVGPAAPPPQLSREVPTRAASDAAIHLGSGTAAVATGEGAVWVLQWGKLQKIDPGSGQVLATIPNTPGLNLLAGANVVVGEGAVWLPGPFRLLRIDARTGQVTARIPTRAGNVAVGAGSVWIASPRKGIVWRIDPQTSQVIATIHVGRNPMAVATGAGAVWVLNRDDGTISRIDPNTETTVATVHLGDIAVDSNLAVGEGGVWVPKGMYLLRIDPARNQPARVIPIHDWVGQVAVGGGAVWLTSRDCVVKVDPQSGRVVEKILVPGHVMRSLAMAPGENALWVIRFAEDTLWRIDYHSTTRSHP